MQIQGLSKSFGDRRVVDRLDLTLAKGEILCLLGSSGCGKTTTLRMIAGLLPADEGIIRIDGEEIGGLPPESRPVSTVFQSYALFPHLNVLQNVVYGLKFQKMPKRKAEALGMEFLEIAGLADYARSPVQEISGGQQQRVALMRSLILRPKVLLLDEPLSNLDANLRVRMRREIRQLRDQFDLTMVFVTHDREEAMTMATRIAIMDRGKIIQIGGAEELYRHPRSGFVMDFFGASNRVERASGEPVYLREEDLCFREDGPIRGVVLSSEFYGFYRRYVVETPTGRLSVLCGKEENHPPGSQARLAARMELVMTDFEEEYDAD